MTTAIESIIDRFKNNFQGFWKVYWPLLILFFIALLFDGVSTAHFMMSEGTENTEMHPVVDLAAQLFGPIAGPLLGTVGKFAAGIIVAIYWRRIAWIILLVVSILSIWAGWYNFWGWQYYDPSIYVWWPL